MGERILRKRPLNREEAERYGRIRAQLDAEWPELRRRALAAKPRVLFKHVLRSLKAERLRQGLSLADVKERSGIDRGTLSKLENEDSPNVTMNTLMRYASALGKTLCVQLEDAARR
jgi:DNA-binding Xre family transcriptional regulator